MYLHIYIYVYIHDYAIIFVYVLTCTHAYVLYSLIQYRYTEVRLTVLKVCGRRSVIRIRWLRVYRWCGNVAEPLIHTGDDLDAQIHGNLCVCVCLFVVVMCMCLCLCVCVCICLFFGVAAFFFCVCVYVV
eukprot:GHVQ01020503.1.p1 GENE.GHVQ01020503.1~~GHVQ01020503.1.p1  ORF type:complete len:130 (+),score=3.64 GHVQ01020503.1:89-478(+)